MKCYYLDASALVKRYVHERGSEWIRAIMGFEEETLLFTSRMTIVEVISAFCRRVREGTLALKDFASARDMFRVDCLDEYLVIPPPQRLWTRHACCWSGIPSGPTMRPIW